MAAATKGVYAGRFAFKEERNVSGTLLGTSLWWWCAGCDEAHRCPLAPYDGASATWDWNGDHEYPTLSPSVACEGKTRCHSYLRSGRQEFLADCGHALAGKTVVVSLLPEWMRSLQR